MDAFAAATQAMFEDPHLAEDVTWHPGGGADPVTLRAMVRVPDEITSFSGVAIKTETLILHVQVADVAQPEVGQSFLVRGSMRGVQGEPRKDSTGLIWQIDTAPLG